MSAEGRPVGRRTGRRQQIVHRGRVVLEIDRSAGFPNWWTVGGFCWHGADREAIAAKFAAALDIDHDDAYAMLFRREPT